MFLPVFSVLGNLIHIFDYISQYGSFSEGVSCYFRFMFKPSFLNASFIIGSVLLVAIGIILVLKRTGIELPILLGVVALKVLFFDLMPYTINAFRYRLWTYSYVNRFSSFVQTGRTVLGYFVETAVILILIAVVILFMKKPRTLLTYTAFVPGVLMLFWQFVSGFLIFVRNVSAGSFTSALRSFPELFNLYGWLYTIALLLLGLWIYQISGTYGSYKKIKNKTV